MVGCAIENSFDDSLSLESESTRNSSSNSTSEENDEMGTGINALE